MFGRTLTRFSIDWFIVDLAMQAYGKVTVALYDTLGDDSVGAPSFLADPDSCPLYFYRIHVRIYVQLGPTH